MGKAKINDADFSNKNKDMQYRQKKGAATENRSLSIVREPATKEYTKTEKDLFVRTYTDNREQGGGRSKRGTTLKSRASCTLRHFHRVG